MSETQTPELNSIITEIDTMTWELNTVFQADELNIDKQCFDTVMDALNEARKRIVVADELFKTRIAKVRESVVNNF